MERHTMEDSTAGQTSTHSSWYTTPGIGVLIAQSSDDEAACVEWTAEEHVALEIVSRHDWGVLLSPVSGCLWRARSIYLYSVSPSDLDMLRDAAAAEVLGSTVYILPDPVRPGDGWMTDIRTYRAECQPELARWLLSAYLPTPRFHEQWATHLGQQQAADKEQWPKLTPLPPLLPAVQRLPDTLLPGPLRPWLLDITARMQIPLEYVAIPALIALATVVGRRIGILPKRQDDWLVVPNLWGMIVGRPGVLKTPALQEALRPLARLAAEASTHYEEGKSRAMAEGEVYAAKVEAIKANMRKAAKANKDYDLRQLSEELVTLDREVDPPLRERRYKTNDPTVEKLGELLQENPDGLLLFRDELSGWLRNLDKTGREGDREFYLEAWNGTGSYDFDRIGRGTLHIPALCLSVLGGMTPGKMTTYVAETMQGGMGDDGLLQRFQLVVWPDVPHAWENIDRYPDTQAKNTAYTIYKALDDLKPATLGLVSQDENDIPALRFTAQAQALFDAWRLQLETRLRAQKEEPAFESHLSKFRSLMPSLALLFHLVDVAHDRILQRHEVSLQAAQLAAAWCDFLELHARRVYGAVLHGNVHSAHALLDHIKRGDVHDGDSPRKVSRHHWSLLHTADMVAAALDVLEQHGVVRVETVKTEGRPTEVIRINPELFSSK